MSDPVADLNMNRNLSMTQRERNASQTGKIPSAPAPAMSRNGDESRQEAVRPPIASTGVSPRSPPPEMSRGAAAAAHAPAAPRGAAASHPPRGAAESHPPRGVASRVAHAHQSQCNTLRGDLKSVAPAVQACMNPEEASELLFPTPEASPHPPLPLLPFLALAVTLGLVGALTSGHLRRHCHSH